MPPVANPMWLSKMRRACIFPLFEGYANVYIGVFAHSQNSGHKELFIGRIVLDVARLRQGSTYDVTLPLRKSNVVYSREQRGAIRVRFHLSWFDERKAILSYLPIKKASFQHVTVRCVDNKAFQNVACVVHGMNILAINECNSGLCQLTSFASFVIQNSRIRYSQQVFYEVGQSYHSRSRFRF
jgi:hypothetical protein